MAGVLSSDSARALEASPSGSNVDQSASLKLKGKPDHTTLLDVFDGALDKALDKLEGVVVFDRKQLRERLFRLLAPEYLRTGQINAIILLSSAQEELGR
jgi:hypothetical protein